MAPSRWRHLDFAERKLFLEMARWRVSCKDCGVVVEDVTWADPKARFTYKFEDQVTWLVQHCDKTTVSSLMRISWRTVGVIIDRTVERYREPIDWTQVTAIGVDELSYRKGHRYLTLVTDLDKGIFLSGKEGRKAETLNAFFEEIGEESCERIETVAIDMCRAFEASIEEKLSRAVIVYDRFHVQRLVTDALDETRREEWRRLKGTEEGKWIKHLRYALLKNPWNLTEKQGEKISNLQRTNQRIYRAYLLKESFADIFDCFNVAWAAKRRLTAWLAWAGRSRLQAFVRVARTIRERLAGILRYFESGYSNGPAEGLNNKARMATRQAYGFHSAGAVLAMINLRCTGLTIPLPHR